MKTASGIPIRNLWLLMLYAGMFRTLEHSKRSALEENPEDMPDWIAEILIHAVRHRLLRNLSMALERQKADLTRVRGRIDHIRTKRHSLLEQGRIACSFDHFTPNTPQNRYVRAALDKLSHIIKDRELGRRCRAYSAALEKAGVASAIPRTTTHDGKSPIGHTRTNPEDRQMLAAVELAHSMSIPAENTGNSWMPAIGRDERWLRELFEKAVGGFYDAVLSRPEWSVMRGKWIYWQHESATDRIKQSLPKMQTDIMLERTDSTHTKSRTIIDTKFTKIMTFAQHDGRTIFKSDHIFQIYAYLRSQERNDDPPSLAASGMLLYPSVGHDVDESVSIQGHEIRFATVNLDADSTAIRRRLLSLVRTDLE